MLILSHRGRREGHAFPDNSVEAIDAALRAGCDGVEIDVRGTSDGCAVLWHDRHAPDGRAVAEITHRELSRTAGFDVPLLGAVLARFDGAWFDVELKSADSLDCAAAAIVRADPAKLVVTSFRHDVAVAAAAKWNVECGIIVAHHPARAQTDLWAAFAGVPRLRTIVWEFEALDAAVLEPAAAAGFRHFAWDAIGAADLRRAASLGLAGVIVDR